ncbi:MAG: hypothetical protein HOO67_04695, partial [Candidatus Peribacteraceae bacterium]|nr:hypothetical protein [Candidatus Peribacteraceae bacterium]
MTKTPSTPPRIVYAANRRIGAECLRMLVDAGITPVALMIPNGPEAEATDDMRKLLPTVPVFLGKDGVKEAIQKLPALAPQYLLSVHFPLILPPEILAVPSAGTLNLHPAFLPWNRGWHTPSWAILDGTPYGATLHWIDSGVDTGPIALQRQIEIQPTET